VRLSSACPHRTVTLLFHLSKTTIDMKNRILLLIAFALLALAGCEKDPLRDLDAPDQDFSTGTLTVQQAKKWWDTNKPVAFRSGSTDSIMTALNVTPIWDQAVETMYMGEENIILVPFRWNDRLIHLENRGSINLVIFYDQELGRLSARIMGVIASEDGYDRPLSQFSVTDFSGYIFQIDELGDVPWIIQVENGRFTRQVSNNADQSIVEFRGGGPRCYSFSRGFLGRIIGSIFGGIGNIASQIVSAIGDCFEGGGSDSGGSNGGEVPPYVNPYGGNFGNFGGQNNQGNPGETGGGPGSSPPPPPGNFFSGYFNNDILAAARFMELLFDFMTEYNLGLSVFQLTEIVNPACMETPEIFNGCALNSVLNWIDERVNIGERRDEVFHLLGEDNGALAQKIIMFLEENNDGLQIMEMLFQGMREGHFSIDDIDDLINNMTVVHQKKDWEDIGNNRLETINQIENIRQYLSRRQTDYGDAAQYLESLLPHLIQHSEFTNEEVYRVYELAYEWYSLCVYNVLSSVVRNVIKAVRPFIEMALIESGFHILGNIFTIRPQASFRTISELPASVQSSTAQVWNRVAGTGANIPNTTIPNTFTFTAQNGQKFHVQFSATEHLGELVTQHGAATAQTWFQAQKGLRSQLVLDDFAKAVDEIVARGPVTPGSTHSAGKWREIVFGDIASYSNGNIRIFHIQAW
jgi:hypothetical protein